MYKFTIPAILVVTVLVAGIFAFMPVEKASTVHTTITSAQFNQFASAFTNNTSFTIGGLDGVSGNITASCGSGNSGLVYWTVNNGTIPSGSEGARITSVFTITSDGDTSGDVGTGGNDLQVTLSQNTTTASGVVSISGTPDPSFIIGFDNTGQQDIGEMQVTVQCQSGGTAAATVVSP